VVASLADLPLSAKVLMKTDVSHSVRADISAGPPLIVAELLNGKIIGDLRLVVTADDAVIGDLQTLAGCKDLSKHYSLKRRRLRLPKYWRGKALLLGTANSDNYYAWLLESLSRWKMMQAAGYLDYDYVLLHSRPTKFQEELLNLLQVPVDKRLRCSKNFVHHFERLVVPGMPYPLRQVAPWSCEWVRSLFPHRSGGPERIYLARHGAHRRRMVNESQLEKKLEALGFVSIRPECLPVAEQARMFGAAKCVVAAHGAGLANMVFAPAGALLIELFHPDVLRPTYKNLSTACGLQYTAVVGQRTNNLGQTDDRWAEFAINVPEVLQILAAHC
jgi:capsular polysaccharide biosynthesis protein